MGAARLVAGVFSFLGILGLLRSGGGLSGDRTKDLAGLTVHPVTAIVWLVIGLAGVALSVQSVRARLYLICAGAFLVLWAVVSLLTGGDASAVFTTDRWNIVLYLVLGGGALGVALGPTPIFLEKALALRDADAPEAD
jgi:hypothetical protein